MKIIIGAKSVSFEIRKKKIFSVDKISLEILENSMTLKKNGKKLAYEIFYDSLNAEYKQVVNIKDFQRGVQLYYAVLKTADVEHELLPYRISLIYGEVDENIMYYFSKTALQYYGLFFNSYCYTGSREIVSLMKFLINFINVWEELFVERESISMTELIETSNYINFNTTNLIIKREISEIVKNMSGGNVCCSCSGNTTTAATTTTATTTSFSSSKSSKSKTDKNSSCNFVNIDEGCETYGAFEEPSCIVKNKNGKYDCLIVEDDLTFEVENYVEEIICE